MIPCRAIIEKVERYCPQPPKCVKRCIPCRPVAKTRCIPQPDRIEIEWVKKEVCVPQPDRIEIEWVKKEVCVPQPDRIEIEWVKKEVCVPQPDLTETYYEDVPDEVVEEMVCCEPKLIVEECIKYVPLDLCEGKQDNNEHLK